MNMHHLHDGIPGGRGESRRAAVRRGFRVNKRDGVRGRGWGGSSFPGGSGASLREGEAETTDARGAPWEL